MLKVKVVHPKPKTPDLDKLNRDVAKGTANPKSAWRKVAKVTTPKKRGK